MLGRGIDRILPHPGDPCLYEPYAGSATDYVDLAERASGPIPKLVDPAYVWGDALAEIRQVPDVRIINLETSITRSTDPAPKGINYKMNPDNISVLTTANIDCCVLANNHVIDWGYPGLLETLDVLEKAGIHTAGAGHDAAQAAAPAIMPIGAQARVLVFAFGSESSGIPRNWAAGDGKSGVNLLEDLADRTVARIAARIRAGRRENAIAVASLHWGGNWGYEIPPSFIRFAHALIDVAGCDVVHGHSSHHAKGLEIYKGKLIVYGCGDFLNDYEGIKGYETFRDDLAILYLPRLAAADGRLLELRAKPFRIRKFRLNRASRDEAEWLRQVLTRESAATGCRVALEKDNTLVVTGA
jgi:poly-gamma-glutamate capsule biosynthesis protein CapA/YwtB (metallophosphatase superfamily)